MTLVPFERKTCSFAGHAGLQKTNGLAQRAGDAGDISRVQFRTAVRFCPSVQFLSLVSPRKMNRDRQFPARLLRFSQIRRLTAAQDSDKHAISFSVLNNHKSRPLILLRTLCRCGTGQVLCNQPNPNSSCKTPAVGINATRPWGSCKPTFRFCPPFVFMVLRIAFPASHLFSKTSALPPGVWGAAHD
jgi:hypothetical protein